MKNGGDSMTNIVQVKLQGGSPWGFSLKGGSEHHCPLTVAKVEPGGKAAISGLVLDDVLVSINDTLCPSHSLAVSLVKGAKDMLTITVKRGTLENNTMKMADIYQSIPEEADRSKAALNKETKMMEDVGWVEKSRNSPESYSGTSGITKRMKKQSIPLQRPKSWHNAEAIRHHQEQENRLYEKIPETLPVGKSQYSPYVGQIDQSGSPSVDNLRSHSSYNNGLSRTDSFSVGNTDENIYANLQDTYMEEPSSNKENYRKSYWNESQSGIIPVNSNFRPIEIEPAETYPKVAMAMQVQNTQQRGVLGRLQADSSQNERYTSAQTYQNSSVVNYSTVALPQKQYAKSANVSGEKRDPPPIPKRVDSRQRTHQLSEQGHLNFGLTSSEHVKSSSWPATKAQETTTDTLTQSSVISPTNLPPVKLSPSQEEVYPQQRKPYKTKTNQTTTSTSHFELYTAKPFIIDSPTDTKSWFTDSNNGADLSKTWHGYEGSNSPPSPPTRDTDHSSASKNSNNRGARYQTNDLLMKQYASYLEECLSQEESIKKAVVTGEETNFPTHETYLYQSRTQDYSPSLVKTHSAKPLLETAPISPRQATEEVSSAHHESLEKMNRKNSLHTQSNDRTWKNPKEFATKPASNSTEQPEKANTNRDAEWEEIVHQSQQAHLHVRTNSELKLKGNAPRNRTPISSLMLEGLEASDLKVDNSGQSRTFSKLIEESEKKKSEESRDSRRSTDLELETYPPPTEGNSQGTWETSQSKFSSDDLRKLDQIRSSNSLLTQLQVDNQSMKFYGGEDFTQNNGPEVATEAQRASPVNFLSSHYRSGSYQGESGYRPDHESGHHRSSSYTLNSQPSHSMSSNSTNNVRALQKDFPERGYTVHGGEDVETPDVSMETKLRRSAQDPYLFQRGRSDSEQRLNKTDQYSTEAEPSRRISDLRKFWDADLLVDGRGDHKHSKSDSDHYRRPSLSDRHQHKVSDPSGAIRKDRKVSDTSDRDKIKVALNSYVQRKNSQSSPPSSSQSSSPYSSRPGSLSEGPISPYGTRSDHYASSSSLVQRRQFTPGLQDKKQGMFASQSSLAMRPGRYSDAGSMYSNSRNSGVNPRPSAAVTRSQSITVHPTGRVIGQERRRQVPVHSPRRLSGEVAYTFQKSTPASKTQNRIPSVQNIPVDVVPSRTEYGYLRSPPQDNESLPSQSPSLSEHTHPLHVSVPSDSGTERSSATIYLNQPSRVFRFPAESDVREQYSPSRPRSNIDSNVLSNTSPTRKSSPPPYQGSRSSPPREYQSLPEGLFEVDPREVGEHSPPLPPPPPPPPPDEFSPMDEETSPMEDFPPPPPELLGDVEIMDKEEEETRALHNSPPKGDNITVIRVDSNQVERTSLPVQSKVISVSFSNSSSIEDLTNPDLQIDNYRPDPLRGDNRDITKESNQSEKTEVENLEEKADIGIDSEIKNKDLNEDQRWRKNKDDEKDENSNKELEESQTKPLNKVSQEEFYDTDDPLVISVLQSLSLTETFSLRDLFPERQGRKASRAKMPIIAGDRKNKNPSGNESGVSPSSPQISMGLSSYLQISPAKAMLLTRAKGLQGRDINHGDNEQLRKTKENLIDRIDKKVTELRNTQQEVEEETQSNDELGRQVDQFVRQACNTTEYSKYSMYVGDLDKVTKLNLNLSRKLAKVDSILSSLGEDSKEERINLEQMRNKFASRSEEAKMLKQSISDRHKDISKMLTPCLSSEEHEDFCHFTQMCPRLLIATQEIAEKIRLGEEQLQALRDSLSESEVTCSDKSSELVGQDPRDENGNCDDMEKTYV